MRLTLGLFLAMTMVATAGPAVAGNPPTITTVAGTGTAGFAGDGGPAREAAISAAEDAAVLPNGEIVFVDTYNNRIRVIAEDGTIRTIAGTGAIGSGGDGGPALDAQFFFPFSIDVRADGAILIADSYNQRIRLISPDGTIQTVAGNGARGYSGDGSDATAAQLSFPFGVAWDHRGGFLIADTFNNRVRRVDGSGQISTIAGTGTGGFSGDGGPAYEAQLRLPYGVALSTRGEVFIADTSNNRVRMIDRAGRISTLAGNGARAFGGDGGPAPAASLAGPAGVDVLPNGLVVVVDTFNNRVRLVDKDGTIVTLAGNGIAGYSGDEGPASEASISPRGGIGVTANGTIVLADTFNRRIRLID